MTCIIYIRSKINHGAKSCPITGEILLRSDLLLGMNFRMIHPFLKKQKEIHVISERLSYRFTASKNIRERKIYYLATLNMSDLVEFRSPANQMPGIMECTFIDLATLVPWIDYAKGMMAGEVSGLDFRIMLCG